MFQKDHIFPSYQRPIIITTIGLFVLLRNVELHDNIKTFKDVLIIDMQSVNMPPDDERWQLRSYVTDEYVISSVKSTSFFKLLKS